MSISKEAAYQMIHGILTTKEFEEEVKLLAKMSLDKGDRPGSPNYHYFLSAILSYQNEGALATMPPSVSMDSFPKCQYVLKLLHDYTELLKMERAEIVKKTSECVYMTMMRMFDKPVNQTRQEENKIIEEMKRGNKRNANSNKGREAQSS